MSEGKLARIGAVSGIAMGILSRRWYEQQVAWERYLAEARALGYTEREARLVVAGIVRISTGLLRSVDVLAEARRVLAEAEF